MVIRLVTLLLLTVAVAAQDDRITDNVTPISYKLTFLRRNLASTGTFQGKLELEFKVSTAATEIQLHSQGLDIIGSSSIALASPPPPPPPPLPPTDVKAVRAGDRVTFTGLALQPAVNYVLTINYEGSFLDTNAQGFYSDRYPNTMNEPFIGLTQFGTTSARRVFPCLDQPDKKAKFIIQINYDADYKVHSNTIGNEVPVPTEVVIPSGWPGQLFAFPVTKKISPHVVAWTITKHSSIPTTDKRIFVWYRKSLTPDTLLDVTKEVVPKVLKQLETYLDYKLFSDTDRLNLFVVAKTKFSGMENFGLPIFSEAAITFKDGESSSDDRQRICQLVTHEIAQQWFGDLVTPKWWDEVWLSEGFATYFQYFTLAEVETAWQMDEQFVIQQTQVALQVDSGANTDTLAGKHREINPLIIPNVKTTVDIERVFDSDVITSSKGASVVRMLRAILGDVAFKKNLKSYLSGRAEGNVDTAYLWDQMGASLTLPSSLTLANVMEKWATKAGFPVISVTRNYVTEKVSLEQSQFLLPPHTPKGTPITWNVPIFWTTEKEPTKAPLHWLLPSVPDTNQINLPSVTKEQWLLVNKDQAGFYRVNYDQKNWQLLSKSFLKLTTSSRAMLLDDALNLARGGRLDYVTALDVTELLPNEMNYTPWSAALNGFSFLYDRLSNEAESREVIEKYILEKLTYIYVSIDGFEIKVDDTHVRLLMKQLILHWACRVGHKACIQKAVDLFNSLTLSTNTIKSDVRRVSYCTGIKKGRNVDFNLLKARYTTSTNPDNPRIVYGLGCSTDTDTLRKYLEDSVTTPTILTQINIIGRQVFTAVCQNPIGIQLALDFLMHQWHQASNVWGELEVSKAFSEDLAPKLNTPGQLNQLKNILAFNTNAEIKKGVNLAIGTLEDTLFWQKNHRDKVIGAMDKTSTPQSSTPQPSTPQSSTPKPSTPKPSTPKPESSASSITISVFLLLVALIISL